MSEFGKESYLPNSFLSRVETIIVNFFKQQVAQSVEDTPHLGICSTKLRVAGAKTVLLLRFSSEPRHAGVALSMVNI